MGKKPDRHSQVKQLAVTMLGLLALLGTIASIPILRTQAQSAFQTWDIVDDSGCTATLTVDSSGNFSGSGWTFDTYDGPVPIFISQGIMSGTNMTFVVSGSSAGGFSGTGWGAGKLNASFPSATSASGTGTVSIKMQDTRSWTTGEWSFAWTATRTSAQPTFTPTVTPIPTTTPTATPISTPTPITPTVTPSPTESGYDVTGQPKLGWVLYGRTDMSDEEAKAEYTKRAQGQLKELELAGAAAGDRLASYQNQYDKFKEAVDKQNLQGITQALQSDLDEAKKDRLNAMIGFGLPVAGLATSKELEAVYPTWAKGLEKIREGAEPIVDLSSSGVGGWQLGQFANDAKEKIDKGQHLDSGDWRKFAEAIVGLATTFAAKPATVLGVSNPIGMTANVTGAILGGVELALTERRVRIVENSLQQSTIPVEQNRRLLLNRIEMEKARKEAFDRQKALLTENKNRYLDLKGQ